MQHLLSKALLTGIGIMAAGCTQNSHHAEAFTGPLKPTDAVPGPVENICPIALRTGCEKTYSVKGAKIPGRVGQVSGDVRIISSDIGGGVFLNAPTATLAPGRYALTFDYEYVQAAGEKPARYDLIYLTEDKKKVITQEGNLPAGSAPLELTPDLTEKQRQFQFRVHYSGEGQITAKHLSLAPK